MTMQELARRIKRDSRSLRVQAQTDCVIITPVFQETFTVCSWEEWQAARKAGRCEFPDSECPMYGDPGE